MTLSHYLQNFKLPDPNSHKGQNGKLMIIGGSELFHAASKWSLDVASKFVDMVFYSSVPSNNELIHQAKGDFWNGIVIGRSEVENYIDEADCVLIGPGMTRDSETENITNSLLKKYPQKKWVIDAGALQMVDPALLNEKMILTPHHQELQIVLSRLATSIDETSYKEISVALNGVTIVLKGPHDIVFNTIQLTEVSGGNAGMTKGGTGDVLAGLIAALYTTQDVFTAALVGSYINKMAGDSLYQTVGPNFNSSDLVDEIPRVLWQQISANVSTTS